MTRQFTLLPFSRAADILEQFEAVTSSALRGGDKYPPYDIIKESDDVTLIKFAVAGFHKSDCEVTVDKDILTISGELGKYDEGEYVHRGISKKAFEKKFQLSDDVSSFEAFCEDGILSVRLTREVPEEKKPRTIEIA